jgi:hypothetical protein
MTALSILFIFCQYYSHNHAAKVSKIASGRGYAHLVREPQYKINVDGNGGIEKSWSLLFTNSHCEVPFLKIGE